MTPFSAPLRPRVRARQALLLESVVRLTVNLLLAVAAASTLTKLWPHYQQQQAELDDLSQVLSTLQKEHEGVWQEFGHNFDPAQASRIMEEQSGLEEPDHHPIVLIDSL